MKIVVSSFSGLSRGGLVRCSERISGLLERILAESFGGTVIVARKEKR
jgi:hypothetical protein